MLESVVMGFVAGFFVGNGLPYFVLGSFAEEHAFLLGRSARANVLAGWVATMIGGGCWSVIHRDGHIGQALVAASLGALAVGLIHARVWKSQG